MWSEHCSYKSSRLHLKKLPTRGKLVVQGPGENAGIIDIGGGYVIAFKIESHNHPSFIEPFQGAATGVGGILRDIFTMGARPIAVLDSLRFGRLDDPATGARNRRILAGVVAGIAHYGNCFGVPTVGGECIFEPCYDGNPLVNVFALGVCQEGGHLLRQGRRRRQPRHLRRRAHRPRRHPRRLHGQSAEFTEESKQKRPNVQVGDPFMEKLLLEACLEAMQTGAIVGIQDMGAAGLTCSTCEMGSRGEVGIEIELDRVPQRETGMTPYEIMLSESQERMLLVADKGREDEVFDVFRKWGLDAVEIGVVTDDGKLRVQASRRDRRRDPQPRTRRRSAALRPPAHARRCARRRSNAPAPAHRRRSGRSAARCSPRPTSAPSAGSGSSTTTWSAPTPSPARAPTPPSSASRKPAHPSPCRSTATAATAISRRAKARKLAVAECCRNLSTVGAQPVAATNCLNFGNPERPEIMAQLVEAIEGMAEACRFFDTPITGGNVSLYNETLGEGIYPDAGDGHRRPDEHRAAGADSVPERRPHRRCCSAASAPATTCASAAPSTPRRS